MSFLGLDVGSWAEWVGASGTIAAVIVALWQANRSRNLIYKMTAYKEVDSNGFRHVKFTFINKNLTNMEMQLYGFEVYRYPFLTKKVAMSQLEVFEKGQKILEPNRIDIVTEEFIGTFEGWVNGDGNTYFVPYLLDTSGVFYKSKKRYKFKLDEIRNYSSLKSNEEFNEKR